MLFCNQEFLEVMREREKERTLQKQKFDTVSLVDLDIFPALFSSNVVEKVEFT